MTEPTFDTPAYRGTLPESYERYFVPAIAAPLARDLVGAASLRPGERVLDVACGTGVVARLAAERVLPGGSVAGLDVNAGMLAVARSVTPAQLSVVWYETSAEAMPLPDASFDAVLCQMGLQFVPNRLEAMREIRRILRPGGRSLVSVPGPTPAPLAVLRDVLATHVSPESAGFVSVVFSLHEPTELRELAREAGFSEVRVDRETKTLELPAPRDFLWQYVHSTPLSMVVSKASAEKRAAIEDEVVARWRDCVVDGRLRLDVELTTVRGA